ncbi:MAG: ATP-binding protein [Bacteroidales bacterium]|nr:ATP-binding protein [Bacteroidales bacterium]
MRELPIGIQTFSEIVNRNCVYVDKTELIYKMVSSQKYIFLSRPRRFGKSLLISTLQSYFEGRKDLFNGCKINELDTQWIQYPVVTLSFASCKSDKLDAIVKFISITLSEQEFKFGLVDQVESSKDDKAIDINFNVRLSNIVDAAYQKNGKQVAILIDEYDALMFNTITDLKTQDAVRVHLNNLFSPIKDLDPKLKFVFITGITKLSQMSIFSTLNNLTDISLDSRYCTLCGFTENEVRTELKPYVEDFANKFKCNFDDAIARLKQRYDGYKFSDEDEGVFNPYSLLRALDSKVFKNYWVETATPSSLLALLRENENLQIGDLESVMLSSDFFDTPVERVTDIIPLLYQSGYLSIKNYDADFDQYEIGFPNSEVKFGFLNTLMKKYAVVDNGKENSLFRRSVVTSVKEDNPEILLKQLQDFMRKIPYPNTADTPEWYYQNLLYAILATCGLNVQTEIRTSDGRIDFVLFSPKSIFIFEFKLNKSAEEALSQIDEKQYANKYSFDDRKIWKIGVNFSSEERTVDEWKVGK